jgi:hypothetical protein
MAKLWRIEFTVRPRSGYLSFPMDMLRYDCCTPASTGDAIKIRDNPLDYDDGVWPEDFSVDLVHYSHGRKGWTPTAERWRSFGWIVSGRPSVCGL